MWPLKTGFTVFHFQSDLKDDFTSSFNEKLNSCFENVEMQTDITLQIAIFD